jgi:hypothetical protein
VYSAEEKRALALITFEEKQQKENKIISDFREGLATRRSAMNVGKPGAGGEQEGEGGDEGK